MATLHTIGHSTRTLEELVTVLQTQPIETLADTRSFPSSRRLPYFDRGSLEKALREAGIRYLWRKALGGFRKKIREDSPNTALRSAGFPNYADYMLTPEFEQAVAELVRLAEGSRTAYRFAERVWFDCHRMRVSDWLVSHGHAVLHIDGEEPPQPHRLTRDARLLEGPLIYRGDRLFS